MFHADSDEGHKMKCTGLTIKLFWSVAGVLTSCITGENSLKRHVCGIVLKLCKVEVTRQKIDSAMDTE